MSDRPWWRDWRGLPPSASYQAKPLSSRRVWLARVGLLAQVVLAVSAIAMQRWFWLLLPLSALLGFLVQPDIHRRQVLGSSRS